MSLNKNLSGSNIINHQSRGVTLFKINKKKSAKKKLPLVGFPWHGKFMYASQINDYFRGDSIQCLLCGREYKTLGIHVNKMHSMTPDEYKIKYGLPLNRGLTSDGWHYMQSHIQKNLYTSGVNPLSDERLRLKGSLLAKAKINKRRPDQPFNTIRKKETHKYSPSVKPKFCKADIDAVFARVKKENRTIASVCSDPDMPSKTIFYKYLKEMK